MIRFKRSSRWLSLLLALAVALLPMLPAFAAISKGADAHAAHAAHMQKDAASKQAPCDQHDGCNGQCCAACAQCFTAAVSMALVFKPSFPVQVPAQQQLHSFLMIAAHNRPPQTAI
ncbi:MAG: hypothetical protein HY081_08530 [Gammaproteobacteria bacterium]|nr:hypothetical protein [Gammaproteobacteria bacterium]